MHGSIRETFGMQWICNCDLLTGREEYIMENIYIFIKKHKLLLDILNVILGVIVIVLIVLVLINPKNQYLLAATFCVGGLMNISNGLIQINDKQKKVTSISLIAIGIIIITVGVLIIII